MTTGRLRLDTVRALADAATALAGAVLALHTLRRELTGRCCRR